MTRLYCDGPTLMQAVASAVANLERHVDEVDALNVFPVPDGDTGSNMLATMRAALAEAERLPEAERDLHGVADALSRGALTGARGNSGVILSQIIRGMTDGADGRRRASGVDLALGLRRASEVAYGSVLTPVEGTILTVIRDAAEAAETAAGKQPHVEAVLADTIEAAARSVQRTPTLLPVLEDAGVVDSGGQGLYRLLEGTMQLMPEGAPGLPGTVSAPYEAPFVAPSGRHPNGGTRAAVAAPRRHDHAGEGQHGYEVEYLLTAGDGELDVEAIRSELQAIGDSLVVAGDERLLRVHVHGPRPDLAIGIGLRWGRLAQVQVLDLDDQVASGSIGAAADGAAAESSTTTLATSTGPDELLREPAPEPPISLAIVAIADADGLAATLESLGTETIRPAHGSRASVGEIAAAIVAAGARQVLVLPNDRDAHLAAGQAASLTPQVAVSVIPTRNVAEGVAAALAFDSAASLEENTERMEAEAAEVRSFSVSAAARGSVVDGRPVAEGQLMALDAGRHLLALGDSLESVALDALGVLADFELVTCYRGAELSDAAVAELVQRIGHRFGGVEVEVIAGGQRYDQLLVAVE